MNQNDILAQQAAMQGYRGVRGPSVENLSEAKTALEARAKTLREHIGRVDSWKAELARIEAMLAADAAYAEASK